MSAIIDKDSAMDAVVKEPTVGQRLFKDPVAIICLSYLGLLVLVALTIDLWIPYSISEQNVLNRLAGPSPEHWLGTDELGRDLLSRALYGTQVAVKAPLIAVSIALALGVTAGILAGYFGGWWDRIVMRMADVLQSIPLLLIAFAAAGSFGRSLTIALVAVGIVLSASYMRIARAVALSISQKLYVDSARVLGLRSTTILIRYVALNSLSPLIVQTALLVSAALLIEASLSFVGIGTELGTPSWGSMLTSASQYQDRQILLSLVPGILITVTVLACNLIGDSMRDLLFGQRRSRKLAKMIRISEAARPKTGAIQIVGSRSEKARAAGVATDSLAPAPLLSVQDLTISFPHQDAEVNVVSDVNFEVEEGETFGLVGESGSGKSMVLAAVMGLLPAGGRVSDGAVEFEGVDHRTLSRRQIASLRGRQIAIISQDPMASLSPVHTIGKQISETMRVHLGYSAKQAWEESAKVLDLVGVPDAKNRLNDYPHQFSGGMAQRVMIAAALACKPKILLADEPTTALDVRIQAQVLQLINSLREEMGMTLIMVSHDLGVIAETCERIAVMYAGEIVETGKTSDVLSSPQHPYTSALLHAMPRNVPRGGQLLTIPGIVPPPWADFSGCRFAPRCAFATESCTTHKQVMINEVRCERTQELELQVIR